MGQPKLLDSGVLNVQFGMNVTVVQPVNLYGCQIGDDVVIGPFVEIQKNVRVGNGTRIQSHTFICELVTIGEACVVALRRMHDVCRP